jgi:hypothetical protein
VISLNEVGCGCLVVWRSSCTYFGLSFPILHNQVCFAYMAGFSRSHDSTSKFRLLFIVVVCGESYPLELSYLSGISRVWLLVFFLVAFTGVGVSTCFLKPYSYNITHSCLEIKRKMKLFLK